jgi:hypothetical protein
MHTMKKNRLVLGSLRIGLSILGAAASIGMFGAKAEAACLGLTFPPPESLNICKTLLTDLVVPPVKSCGHCGWWTPECCLPGSCLAFPECTIITAAGYIKSAGDLYCNTQDINRATFISDVRNSLYRANGSVTLASGGTSSPLFMIGGYYVDVLECAASTLSTNLQDVVKQIATLPNAPSDIYQSVDVSGVRILNRSYSGASEFLRDGYAGITLGTLVILSDDRFNLLKNWSYTWSDLAWGRVPDQAKAALYVLVHELVHVRQYREAGGREAFLNTYLEQALLYGYSSAPFEERAYAIGDWAQSAAQRKYWGNISAFLASWNW